jgi:hypothetical protein
VREVLNLKDYSCTCQFATILLLGTIPYRLKIGDTLLVLAALLQRLSNVHNIRENENGNCRVYPFVMEYDVFSDFRPVLVPDNVHAHTASANECRKEYFQPKVVTNDMQIPQEIQ